MRIKYTDLGRRSNVGYLKRVPKWRTIVIAGITPTQLILEASLPVQLVLLTLLGLSIVSWVMIFQRALVLSAASKGVLSFEHRFWSGMDLSQLYKEGSQMQKEDIPVVGMEGIFRAGFKEFMRLRQQPTMDKDCLLYTSDAADE